MPGFLVYKNKFKSDNCISMQMLITNNERFQTTIAKSVPSNNSAIYALDNNEFFSLITSSKYLYSCRSKYINKNKNDNKLFSFITLTKHLCNCENKYISKNIKDSDSMSQIATVLSAASTKRLTKCKTAHATVHSNLSKKTEIPTLATTIQ